MLPLSCEEEEDEREGEEEEEERVSNRQDIHMASIS